MENARLIFSLIPNPTQHIHPKHLRTIKTINKYQKLLSQDFENCKKNKSEPSRTIKTAKQQSTTITNPPKSQNYKEQ